MRLSFGQELRMVQKQVLAPRMIQSMEILQLPIMALQERIEQEMQENPVLDLQEEDLDLPEEPAEAVNPDAPSEEERELVVDENKKQRRGFRAAAQHGRGVARPLRGALASRRARGWKKKGHESTTRWPTWWPVRNRCRIICTTSSAGSTSAPELRAMCDRIIYNLDANGYLQGRLEDIDGCRTRGPEQLALASEALAVVQRLDPPGVAARDLRECLLLQLMPGMPYYEQLKTLISDPPGRLEHNRLPVIERRTGYSIALIQQTLVELRKLNPKPGANFGDIFVPNVTPDVFVEVGRRRQVQDPIWRTAARRSCISAAITASC